MQFPDKRPLLGARDKGQPLSTWSLYYVFPIIYPERVNKPNWELSKTGVLQWWAHINRVPWTLSSCPGLPDPLGRWGFVTRVRLLWRNMIGEFLGLRFLLVSFPILQNLCCRLSRKPGKFWVKVRKYWTSRRNARFLLTNTCRGCFTSAHFHCFYIKSKISLKSRSFRQTCAHCAVRKEVSRNRCRVCQTLPCMTDTPVT